ncbi:hypothetical protein [Streptomyces sp. NPDC059063]|uniref:hypothetical protein n=1 Tax=unclassified Streptomyces TaxID=2593676 RepID=UPI0036A673E1
MSNTPRQEGEPEEPLNVTVTEGEPLDGGPEGVVPLTATVAHPRMSRWCVIFEYFARPGYTLAPVAVSLRPAPGLSYDEYRRLPIGDIRNLPLVRWESAARLHVDAYLMKGQKLDVVPAYKNDLDWEAQELALEHYPDIADVSTPGAMRRRKSMTHLASVAMEYTTHTLAGVKDPAAAIARSREANPATVRSWIHRARKAGFLPETDRGGS